MAPRTRSSLTSYGGKSASSVPRPPLQKRARLGIPKDDSSDSSTLSASPPPRQPLSSMSSENATALKSLINEKDAKIATLESALAHSQKEQIAYRAKYLSSQAVLDEVQAKVAAKEVLILGYQQDVPRLQAEWNKCEGALKDCKIKLADTEKDASETTDKLRKRAQELIQAQKGLKKSLQDFAKVQEEHVNCASDLEATSSKLDVCHTALRESQNERVEICRELAAVREELEESQLKFKQNQAQFDRFKKAKEVKDQELESMRDQLKVLRSGRSRDREIFMEKVQVAVLEVGSMLEEEEKAQAEAGARRI